MNPLKNLSSLFFVILLFASSLNPVSAAEGWRGRTVAVDGKEYKIDYGVLKHITEKIKNLTNDQKSTGPLKTWSLLHALGYEIKSWRQSKYEEYFVYDENDLINRSFAFLHVYKEELLSHILADGIKEGDFKPWAGQEDMPKSEIGNLIRQWIKPEIQKLNLLIGIRKNNVIEGMKELVEMVEPYSAVDPNVTSKKIKGSPTLKGIFLGQSRSEVGSADFIEDQTLWIDEIQLSYMWHLYSQSVSKIENPHALINLGKVKNPKAEMLKVCRFYLDTHISTDLFKIVFEDDKVGDYLDDFVAINDDLVEVAMEDIENNKPLIPLDSDGVLKVWRMVFPAAQNQKVMYVREGYELLGKFIFDDNQRLEAYQFYHSGLVKLFNITDDMELDFIAQQFVNNVSGLSNLESSGDVKTEYEPNIKQTTTKTTRTYSHQSPNGWDFNLWELETTTDSPIGGKNRTVNRQIFSKKTKTISF